MNRDERRKAVLKIVNNVVKGRAEATKKPQWGFGFIITNRMIAVTFWRWVWTPYDRRLK